MIKEKKKCSIGISVAFGMNQVVDLLLNVLLIENLPYITKEDVRHCVRKHLHAHRLRYLMFESIKLNKSLN